MKHNLYRVLVVIACAVLSQGKLRAGADNLDALQYVFQNSSAQCTAPCSACNPTTTIPAYSLPVVGTPSWDPASGISYGDWLLRQAGLAHWQVTEPSANVWLTDIPFIYHASRGRDVHFKLVYKNHSGIEGDCEARNPSIFSVGARWHTPWRSYIQSIPSETNNFWIFLGDGTAAKYTLGILDYRTRTKLATNFGTYVLDFPSGERRSFAFTNSLGGTNSYFLTKMEDPQSNPMQFQYTITNNCVRLSQVLDVDNRAITFQYSGAGPYSNVITKIIGPHGLTNCLYYDASGNLTNITDVIGLSSRMIYIGTNLTSLITPYGTNDFSYYEYAGQYRAVRVNELNTRKHLFLYSEQVDGAKIPSDYAGYRPTTTNSGYFSFTNTLDAYHTDQRNSLYWNPRQYENITATIRTALDTGSFNPSNLTSGDYLRGRQRHWLKSYGETNVSRTLSVQRDPSPDGSVQGLVRWYDYANKEAGSPDKEGTMGVPRLSAYKLPNGEPRFILTERNQYGHLTNKLETFTGAANSCQVRTNQYFYATNNIDLVLKVELRANLNRSTVSNIWNAFHRVTTNYNALNEIATYSYNANQQILTMRDRAGLTTSNVYEPSGTTSNFLCLQARPVIGWTNTYTYASGNIQCFTDSRGMCVSNAWDALSRLTCATFPDGSCILRGYSNLDLTIWTDRNNTTNLNVYNGFRQRIKIIDARGYSNSLAYCSCGVLDSFTDSMGKTSAFLYDQVGRRCVTMFPTSGSLTNNYNLLGQLTNVIDSSGSSVTNCFNNSGLLCAISNAFGRKQLIIFDSYNQATNVVDGNGITSSFAFDDRGRKTQSINASNKMELFGYSASGLIAHTNQLGHVTRYGYDSASRKVAETNALGEVILYTYNAAGNLLKLRDPSGNETSWTYDQYGRVTTKTNANGVESLRYAYDPNGRVTNRWSAAKGNTIYRYDSAGNLTNICYASSGNIYYSYDANNHLTAMVDAVGTTIFTFTDFGALESEDGPWASDTITYSYTANHFRSQMTLSQPNASSWEQVYTYDLADRLSSVTSPAGTFKYLYDPQRNLLVRRLSLPNGAYITNAYDGLGRMTSTILENSANGVLNSHSYGFNVANQRTNGVRTAGDYVNYGYDNIGQLVTANAFEAGGTSRLHEQYTYSYDPAHNLTNRNINGFQQILIVDALNQLSNATRSGKLTVAGTTGASTTNVTVNASNAVVYSDNSFASINHPLVDGTNTFTAVARDNHGRVNTNVCVGYLLATNRFLYDANGNLTSDGVKGYDYDDENQLTCITATNLWKTEFKYDGMLRRRVKDEYLWQNGGWILGNRSFYVWDCNVAIQERDGNNLPLLSYTRGSDLSGNLQMAGGIGGLLALSRIGVRSGDHFYYHADGNGNVSSLIDSNQVIEARYCYDAFGNTLSASGPLAQINPYRFSSKEAHFASGLYYYLYRYLSPSLQRWLTIDPLLDSASRMAHNWQHAISPSDYANGNVFLINDPINTYDVDGLCAPRPGPCCTLTYTIATWVLASRHGWNYTASFTSATGTCCPAAPAATSVGTTLNGFLGVGSTITVNIWPPIPPAPR
jgi:RHS repeat-associated protein